MKKGGIRMQYDLLLKGGMLIDSAHVLGMPDQIGSLKTGAVGMRLFSKWKPGPLILWMQINNYEPEASGRYPPP